MQDTDEARSVRKIEQTLSSERNVRDHFLHCAGDYGLELVKGQEAYPDLYMRDEETGEMVYVELEHLADNFLDHGHHVQEVENHADWLVCATNNLENSQEALLPVERIIALDEQYDANVLYTPHYRLAPYQSAADRRKSMAVRVEEGSHEARLEDETTDKEQPKNKWTDDSKGTLWMPVDDFTKLFSKVSAQQLDGNSLGQEVFGGDAVDYTSLLEYGRTLGRLQKEDDRVVLATHNYYHPRKKENYTAKAVLRVNSDDDTANFRIQHFNQRGTHLSVRTTVYSENQFTGVLGSFPVETQKDVFINGDAEALIREVERVHDVTLSEI